MSHLYLSAAHKSSGKTTISIGLCAALRKSGYRVQAFKKGPDYIDPLWLAQATQRPCFNLDFFTMHREEIGELFARGLHGVDVGVIEGNKGLYDGLALDGSNSNAALAAQLDSPVVLVLDSQGMTRGIAPLILGYQAFEPRLRILGVILNKVGGYRHESKLRAVIEHYTDVRVVGAVHRNEDLRIDERHLGLVPSNELGRSQVQVDRIGELIAEQVDLNAVLSIAATGGRLSSLPAETEPSAVPVELRIGVARDAAFGFYYAGDLEALRLAGAQLLPFSPLSDASLPECDALFIGGGFPETHMDRLHENTAMRESVRAFVERDGPVYAECGGLMYLCDRLTWAGKTRRMAGVIDSEVVMHDRPQGRGYVRLRETAAHPWPVHRDTDGLVTGHEFHYSALNGVPDNVDFAYRVERGYGLDGVCDGVVYRRLLAGYAHQRDTRSHPWARNFTDFVLASRGRTRNRIEGRSTAPGEL